jgi:RNA polymerase subunit RPABC4/transcription elongation factor Spt4
MIPFLIGWPGGSLESALKLGATLLIAYALVLWISAIIWVYRDAKNRTTDSASQVIAVLLVATFNLPGMIVYLVIRPQVTLADAYERSLEAEAVLHELQITANSCQTCRRPIDDDFNVCPHCRTVLREPCRTCSRLVRTSWMTCPYCATDRAPRVQAPAQPQRESAATTEPMRPPARREAATATQRDLLQPSPRRAENSTPQGVAPSRPPARGDR